jgi:cystathionine beta-lyase
MAAFAADRWDWTVDVAATRLVPDVMLGAVELLRLVTGPGDAVVINPPVYPPFAAFVDHAERRLVNAPLRDDGRLDLASLERAYADATSTGAAAHLLCHPHNPTGTLHTADELRAVGELASRYGVRVVADEIHAPLVLAEGSRFVPTTTQIPDAIALHSASKAFNLAGLRAAIAVPGPEAVADLARLPAVVADGVTHLGALAQRTAYAECGTWLDEVLDGLRHNQRLVADLLAAQLPTAVWSPPEATYFAWIDLRTFAEVAAGADPARLALHRGRLAVNPGPTFGVEGTGFVRLNLAASTATLTDAVTRLGRALEGVATDS